MFKYEFSLLMKPYTNPKVMDIIIQ